MCSEIETRFDSSQLCAEMFLVLAASTAFAFNFPAARVAGHTGASTGPALRRHATVRAAESPDLIAAQPSEAVKTWPCGDALDKKIVALAVPAIVNFLVLPITQAVDLFWVGRMGEALATAGQAAANQVFSSAFWLVSFVPTITTPRVAAANAKGDKEEVQRVVGEAIFLSAFIGVALTGVLAAVERTALTAVGNANALGFSVPYLRYRLPGVAPDAISTVGFAAFRGVLDTVTPLKIAIAANLVNVVLDPILIFNAGLGVAGAALATAASQIFAAAAYISLLLRRGLVRAATLVRPPSRAALSQLAQAGGAVQARALALNIAFLYVTRTVQRLDTTGTAAAAHAVTIQLWQLGGVVLFALSTVASILVPTELKREGGGRAAARATASRFLAWGAVLGAALGAAQLAALPMLHLFAPSAEVRAAAVVPSVIGAFLQLINGVTFIGEGVMVGTGSFGALAAGQVVATLALLATLTRAATLNQVWLVFWLFNSVRLANVLRHHFVAGPLVEKASQS